MSITLETRVGQNKDTAWREIAGMSYVIDSSTNELHSFNEVSSRVWKLMDTECTVSEIVDAIVAEFEVERSVAEQDILELLELLSEKGLIVV